MTQQQETKPGTIEFFGGYQVYSESGVDLTLLRENLKRPLEERLEGNRRAVASIESMHLPDWQRRFEEIMASFDAPAILRRLTTGHVEFVVIGGMAIIAHGSAYITKDLDICYERTTQNIAALATALAPLHPYLRGVPPGLPFSFDAPTIQSGLNFTLATDAGDLDVLGHVDGVGDYRAASAQAVVKPLYGLSIRVLNIDALIASKQAAGRTKDKLHLLELEELKKMQQGQS